MVLVKQTKSLRLWIVLHVILMCIGTLAQESGNDFFGIQPRIITQDGHLIFQTAENHNITFRSRGSGSIRINNEDLTVMTRGVKQTLNDIEEIKNNELVYLRERVSNHVTSIQNLESQFTQLQQTVRQLSASITNTSRPQVSNRRVIVLQNKVRNLENQMRTLRRLLNQNECESNPCRNGGTCEDTYNGYLCCCPSNWQGTTCEEDVNECSIYAGTPQACQNGATCQNTQGSFRCQCPPDWYGVICTERHDDCSTATNEALCGHGTCINQPRAIAGQPKYKCLCEPGWTTSSSSPTCDVDVNECEWQHYPCSSNPRVTCFNTPGSYICGHCPPGFSGSGHTCEDINECLQQNGGCSISPMVQCINNYGSRTCGPCPPGYQGNGITCIQFSVCSVGNGGCHPYARCIDNPAMVGIGRECRCPPGYTGSGEGPNGCIFQTGSSSQTGNQQQTGTAVAQNPCQNNPCVNGVCLTVGSSYHCMCNPGYTGMQCQIRISQCASLPCQNGGTCIDRPSGYECTCTSDFVGVNCENEREACGGYLTAVNGTIRYPNNPSQQYPHGRSCAWVISTTPGKVINLTFPEFHLERSNECQFDFLQINDGPSAASHPIGRFCGTTISNISSTHNQIYLWFRSDSSVAADGFRIIWNTTDPVCGGIIPSADYGTINSPGYPGKYPHNRDCYWAISVPFGKRIKFSFATMKLEHHDNCSFDFLEIRDGVSEISPVLQRYCSTLNPPPIETASSFAWLHFHSDESLSDTGFHITYFSIPGIPGCGGTLTAAEGSLSTPDFPNVHTHNLECDWQIRVREGERINLVFTSLSIEFHEQCAFDFIEVRDGAAADSQLIGRYCGEYGANRPLPNVISSSNFLFVKFFADYSVAVGGFRAEYKVVCGGVFRSPTGTFHSPYFPNPYPASRECLYLIEQPPTQAIILEFEEFDVEGPFGDKCIFDYVEVRDGDTEDSPLLNHLCGTSLPETIFATHNYLWIKFKTDDSINNKGFSASYRTENLVCGGIYINQTAGVISSPSHPSEYPHGVTCKWILKAPPGYILRFTFLSFVLEETSNCDYDYVELFDNFTRNGTGHSLGRYCGSRLPPSKTSLDNVVTVIFKSDESVSREGFSMQYTAVDATRACGGDYFSAIGQIRSPNYPDNYPHYRECIWKIQVPTGQQIELNITDFQLEHHTNCRYDFLEIRNGGSASSPLIGQYCGTEIPRLIRSHSHQLYLRFKSDSSQSEKGFLINWDGTSTGCGGNVNAISGTIISPNYPLPYGHSGICQWMLSVSKGSRIQIIVTDLEMEESSSCFYEYLEIKDKGRRFEGKRFCGSTSPSPFSSNTSQVIIKYRSDRDSSRRGFQLRYTIDCNSEIKGRRGLIESPNFPNPYPHDRDCTWTILAPQGNKLNLSFSHLQLESTNNCQYDYVEIKEGHLSDNPAMLLGKFCNSSEVPRILSSTLDKVSVRFVSDYTEALNGFQLEWVVNGCGGELTKDRGSFTSPNYPGAYPPSTVCEWYITVELGKKIELTIEEFSIEASPGCRFDALHVFGSDDEHSPSLASVCHQLGAPMTITSQGNHMFVHFESDYSISGTGFKVSYAAVEGGCGGNFTAPNGKIHTPNYPSRYDAHSDCTWLITVQEHHTVRLSFEDFDVEPSSNCTYDFVSLYDGSSEDANLLLTHCGGSVPVNNIIRSTSNQLLIRMIADPTIQGKGFLANYSIDCGGILNANKGGQLVSSYDYLHYRRSSNCSWLIKAENPVDRVTFTVTHLSLQFGGSNCSDRSLRIYDGFTEDDLLIGPFCGNQAPPPITSHGQALLVVLSAVAYGSDRGAVFAASFFESTSACGGTYTGEYGAFNSPNYPDSYPQETECIWIISASPGNKAMLTFSYFNMEDSEYCNQDYVEIHHNNASGDLLGRFCGSTIPTNLTADNQLWIKFRSDETGTSQGFTAQYSLLHGNELFGSEGQVASPLYPHAYHNSGTYSWRITVPQFKFVKISFDILEIRKVYGECYNSHISIYDGADGSAHQLGQYCGVDLPDAIISSSNQIYIVFQTSMYDGGNRFLLSWKSLSSRPSIDSHYQEYKPQYDCGEDIWISSNNMTTFSSPGYPNGFALWKTCSWTIRTEVGYHIELRFYRIDVSSEPNCQNAYYNKVTVFDGVQGSENWQELGHYCNREHAFQTVSSTSNLMRVAFISGWQNRTGFLAAIKSECGGEIYGLTSGILTSPLYPSNYPIRKTCTWKIVIRQGRTINLNFQDFDIQGSGPTCSGDYLLLRDGGSSLSPLLGSGKYCGTNIPAINATHSNQLFLQFYSDGGNSAKGFKLIWEEYSIGCGGSIFLSQTVTQHVISSPNYPHSPPSHIECQWLVIGLPSHRLRLDFMEHGDSATHLVTKQCTNETLNIYDGGTSLSPILKTYCQNSEGTIWSTGSTIFLHYKNDLSEAAADGFQVKVASAICGGTVVGQNGLITSPDYPNPYQSNQQCEWIFKGPVGHYLTLSFTDFKLSWVSQCIDSVDNVEIRDFNMTGPLLGRYCGNSVPQNVETSDNFALVKFSSDSEDDTHSKGFKLNFEASTEECGGELTTPSGVITSPNYPGSYAHRRYCKWFISVQKGRRIHLEFTDFNLQEGIQYSGSRFPYCPDYVLALNGILRDSPFIPISYKCGRSLPPPIKSHGNMMTFIFRSDGSYTSGGFRAIYSSDEVAVCGGEIRTFPGFLISPGFGNGNYSNSTECIWEISNPVSSNSSLVFVFQNFSLEEHERCDRFDFLSFLYGSTLQESQTIGSLCGNITTGTVVALPYSNIWVRFKTDFLVEGPGFNISYSISNCGGRITLPTSFTSPNFPNNYGNNVHCAWLIELEEGQQIEIEFPEFELENDCNKDYVIIRNGPTSESPQIGKYCGSSRPGKIKTMASYAWIEFHSDLSNTAKGFRTTVTAKSAGCGGMLHGLKGEIYSPNFPERYSSNIECEWMIHADVGYHISLRFKDSFDLEMQETCNNDFIELFDLRNNQWNSLGRKCGAQLPSVVNSLSPKMKVLFHSNEQINGGGFKAEWQQACGGIFSNPTGIIYSPGYPGKYSNNLQCDYLVQGRSNAFIYLVFDQEAFDLEDSTNCKYDRLEIYRGNSSDGQLYGSYCGRQIPSSLSFADSVFLRFISDISVVSSGFRIQYYITECGVTLTNSSGVIHANVQQFSLNLDRINCSWHIRVDPNLVVQLRFSDLNVLDYRWRECSYKYVAVYDGETTTSPLIGKYCNNNMPQSGVTSTNNTMTVNFVLKYFYWTRYVTGFNASYLATYGSKHGCGGILNSTSGSLQSLDWNHDNKYESNLDCTWVIIVPSEKVVKLSFQSFDIEKPTVNYTVASKCAWDFLEVRDGLTGTSPLIDQYCGSIVPPDITSSSNFLYVRFVSDETINKAGFRATYISQDALCGGTLTPTNVSQVIKSPDYPSNYPLNIRCKWLLIPPRDQDMLLTFNSFQVEYHERCHKDYLKIVDKKLPENERSYSWRKILTYCGSRTPNSYISHSEMLELEFNSDGDVTSKGFSIQYQIATCNRTYYENSGEIFTLGYHKYIPLPAGTVCITKIETMRNHTISLYFSSVSIAGDDCSRNYLQIRDGGEQSNLIGTFCGYRIPNSIFSTTNIIWMKLVTADAGQSSYGYKLTYLTTDQRNGCGGSIFSEKGYLTSPLYPGNYSKDSTCYFKIRVPEGNQARLYFTRFDVDGSTFGCNSNYLAIFNGHEDDSSKQIGIYCSYIRPPVLTTNGNEVLLKYVTNTNNTGAGFRLNFWTVDWTERSFESIQKTEEATVSP